MLQLLHRDMSTQARLDREIRRMKRRGFWEDIVATEGASRADQKTWTVPQRDPSASRDPTVMLLRQLVGPRAGARF